MISDLPAAAQSLVGAALAGHGSAPPDPVLILGGFFTREDNPAPAYALGWFVVNDGDYDPVAMIDHVGAFDAVTANPANAGPSSAYEYAGDYTFPNGQRAYVYATRPGYGLAEEATGEATLDTTAADNGYWIVDHLAHLTYMIPGDAADPYDPQKVAVPLETPFAVEGRLPRRTLFDAVLSVQKHVAEVLDERGARWLSGYDANGEPVASDAWEVRPWDEQSAMRLPFARVAAVGPDTITGRTPLYADHSQSMTIHLNPHPAQDSERAVLNAERLRSEIEDALEFGAARTAGLGPVMPLWDFAEVSDLYGDSEARHPSDYMRVEGLSIERYVDPEDDRYAWVVVNFRAQWRRGASISPGQVVQSVRMSAHPE